MAHPRKVIRHYVTNLLKTAGTVAGQRVFASRVNPYRAGRDLPAIAVYTPDEIVDREASKTAPRELERDLDLQIVAWVDPGGADFDDRLDDLCEAIEAAMDSDPFLDGNVAECILESTATGFREDGQQVLGAAVLTYAVIYRTISPPPPVDSAMDDFERAHATTNIAGDVHPDDVVEDQIEVRP